MDYFTDKLSYTQHNEVGDIKWQSMVLINKLDSKPNHILKVSIYVCSQKGTIRLRITSLIIITVNLQCNNQNICPLAKAAPVTGKSSL